MNKLDIHIIYEDEHILAVDKPHGLMVHDDGVSKAPTLVDWFLSRYPAVQDIGEPQTAQDGTPLERSGVIHRLDRDTSGLILLAKTTEGFLHLKEQFQSRTVTKEYRAIVYGRMKEKQGTIERAIGRSASDFRKRSAERGARGKLREASTEWDLIQMGAAEGEWFSYLHLLPKTGRTHQLRVHLKAIDHPIVGDVLYAGRRLQQSYNLGLTRLALHAYKLTFMNLDNQELQLEAPVPEVLEMAVAGLEM